MVEGEELGSPGEASASRIDPALSAEEAGGARPFALARHMLPDGSWHFDLWLERGGVLWSWRLARLPAPESFEPVPAERIFDHRLVYLTRAGDLGPGRGTLTPLARGSYRLVDERPDRIEVVLLVDPSSEAAAARALSGALALERVGEEPPDAEPWTLRRLAPPTPTT